MAIVVEPYSPAWPQAFEAIKRSLAAHLTGVPVVAIEHVGSTSVPGLAAKPIIDIDIIVARADVPAAINALVTRAGFVNQGELGIVDRHALKDPDQNPPRNIYVCVDGAFQTRNHLGLRKVLRNDAALREEYGNLKLDLAARGLNIDEYVEAKSVVVQKILRVAGVFSDDELDKINAANVNNAKPV